MPGDAALGLGHGVTPWYRLPHNGHFGGCSFTPAMPAHDKRDACQKIEHPRFDVKTLIF
jgi:hypothetical protein